MQHRKQVRRDNVSALDIVAVLIHIEAVFAIMVGLSLWLWPHSFAMALSRGGEMHVTNEMIQWFAVYGARIDHRLVSDSVIVLATLLILFGVVRYIMAYVVVGRMAHLYRYAFVLAIGLFVVALATYARNQTVLSIALLLLDVCFVELLRRRIVSAKTSHATSES